MAVARGCAMRLKPRLPDRPAPGEPPPPITYRPGTGTKLAWGALGIAAGYRVGPGDRNNFFARLLTSEADATIMRLCIVARITLRMNHERHKT